MSWETYLLWGALGSFLASFGLTVWPDPDARRDRLARRFMFTGLVLLLLSLALLALYFLAGALHIEYVWSYTRRDYPWYYRLAGLWAGQKGTLVLWAAFTALFGALMLAQGRRAVSSKALPAEALATLRRVRGALLPVLVLLTGSTIVAGTFDTTPGYFLRPEVKPEGNGLQPVLLTPFMIIHPPIQFLAYALTGLLVAGAFAHLVTGDRHWGALIRPWARLAWLLSTLGLGLGGLWAYYVLNFGGFWAWDPVETANLIAWFPLTLLLHALLPTRTGRPRSTAPLYAFLAFALALFSTLATRSGLWVSVHAFTDPSKNFARDPLERFLNILATGTLLQYLAALFAVTLLAGLWAALHGRLRSRGARSALAASCVAAGVFVFVDTVAAYSLVFQLAHAITLARSAAIGLVLLAFLAVALVVLTGPEEPTSAERATDPWIKWMHPRRLLDFGIALLGLALLVVFLIDVAGVNGYDRGIFDARAPYLALPILMVLAATFLRAEHGPRSALLAPFAAAAIGILLSFALPTHARTVVAMPALLLVLYASLQRFWRLHDAPRASRADRAVAGLLLAGALLGLVYWGNPPTQLSLGLIILHPSWAWALPAYAVCAFALLGATLHRNAPGDARSRLAAALLIPVVGPWGLTALCGVLALALSWRSPSAGATWGELLRTRRALLRTSTVYLLHAGLALGLAGYAVATYESHESDELRFGPEGGDAFRGYSFRVLGGTGVGHDPEQGLPEEIHARVLVLHDGAPLEEATLVYWLVKDGTDGHYDARVTVVRRPLVDLYLYPLQLTTPHAVLTDHVQDARPTDPDVSEVVVTAKTLPGMALVWSGLWILGLAMGAGLALGGFAVGSPAPREVAVRHAESAAAPVPALEAKSLETPR